LTENYGSYAAKSDRPPALLSQMVAELCTRAMQARTGRLMLTGRLFRELWATIKSVPNSQVRRLRLRDCVRGR
jgi:hypothetical protein